MAEVKCPKCGMTFNSEAELKEHVKQKHPM
jgi:uncharacterized C2H2 Zn-finger protein